MKRSLNTAYRLVFNESTGQIMAVAETAKGHGKSSGGRSSATVLMTAALLVTAGLGASGPAWGQYYLGSNAGTGVSGLVSSGTTGVGMSAFQNAANISDSVAIGGYAGSTLTGDNVQSVYVGTSAGAGHSNTARSVFVGYDILESGSTIGATTYGGDVYVGAVAATNTVGANNTAIGTNVFQNFGLSGAVPCHRNGG
jgi:Extended Signal Peptide of Type V secretion system